MLVLKAMGLMVKPFIGINSYGEIQMNLLVSSHFAIPFSSNIEWYDYPHTLQMICFFFKSEAEGLEVWWWGHTSGAEKASVESWIL